MKHSHYIELKAISDKITKGTTPTTLGFDFVEEGINFIKAESITRDGNLISSTFAKIDLKTHEALKRSQIYENDILITIAGIYLGKIALVKKQHIPANTNQAVALIRPTITQLNPQYLKYFLLMPSTTAYLNMLCPQSAQPNLNLTQLGKFKITLPPLPIQRKIAAVLSAYDDLIENNNRRIAILEKMAEELYREWFVRLRFPGHENTKIVKGVPEGWENGCIGDLWTVKSGFAFKSEELGDFGYPVIKITNIQNGYIDTLNIQRFSGNITSRISQFELFDSDLLIAMTGAQVGKIGIFVSTNEKFYLNQRTGKFFNKTDIKNNMFIYLFCKTNWFMSQIENFALGAAQPNISGNQIESIKIKIPQINLLKKFSKITDPILQKIFILKKQNLNLTTTRDRLLSRLMSEKIDVEHLDIDFPAGMREEELVNG